MLTVWKETIICNFREFKDKNKVFLIAVNLKLSNIGLNLGVNKKVSEEKTNTEGISREKTSKTKLKSSIRVNVRNTWKFFRTEILIQSFSFKKNLMNLILVYQIHVLTPSTDYNLTGEFMH